MFHFPFKLIEDEFTIPEKGGFFPILKCVRLDGIGLNPRILHMFRDVDKAVLHNPPQIYSSRDTHLIPFNNFIEFELLVDRIDIEEYLPIKADSVGHVKIFFVHPIGNHRISFPALSSMTRLQILQIEGGARGYTVHELE